MKWHVRCSLALFLTCLVSVSWLGSLVLAQSQPDKAGIMMISSHADDEGIFLGGAIPYYTRIEQMDTVLLAMAVNPGNRRTELNNAVGVYGMPNPPIYSPFSDCCWVSPHQQSLEGLDNTWKNWSGTSGGTDAERIQAGKDRAAEFVARQIRKYRPEVVASQDINGEYGHHNHVATSWSAVMGYDLAKSSATIFDDDGVTPLEPWAAKKLYLHDYDFPDAWRQDVETYPRIFAQVDGNGEPIPVPGYEDVIPINRFVHTKWDMPDSRMTFDATWNPNQTADGQANLGLQEHVSQGVGGWIGRETRRENWMLLRSTVGADTVEADGFAYGDFFEHIKAAPPFGSPGDVNLDGFVTGDGTGLWADDDVTAFVDGWKTRGHLTQEERWKHGDMNDDGITDLRDWTILRENHETNAAGVNLGALLAAVPEPTTAVLALFLLPVVCVGRSRRMRL